MSGRSHIAPPRRSHRVMRALLAAVSLLAAHSACLAQEVVSTVADVNGKSITIVDLANRINLVIFSSGVPNTPEVRQRMAQQVLQTLINESLQIQEADSMGFKPKDEEIQKQLASIARENGLEPDQLAPIFAQRGIDVDTLKEQIRASIAWNFVIRQRLASQAEVGNEEIDEAMELLEANQNKPRNLVSEIFLGVEDPSKEEQVRATAERIVQQVRSGGSFPALARAFSQSNTAAIGGDLGWLVQGQLEDVLEQTLANMRPGMLAGPIRGSSGYYILLLRERRQAGGGSPDQVTVDLKQIVIALPPGLTEEQAAAVKETVQSIQQTVTGCDSLDGIATLPGPPQVVDIGRLKVSELTAQLQPIVVGLQVGQVGPPLRGQSSVAMFIVCDRVAPKEKLPDREDIRDQLMRGKIDLLARRYLRDLRRAAFIDIRAWSASR